MDHFNYQNGQLFAENVALKIVAETYGTPCYVYSRATLERHWHAFNDAFKDHDHLVCYAAKANSNIAVLNLLARLGSGFDVVSGGELARVIRAGGDPSKVVFSGVGKRFDEIEQALKAGIYCFNVESRQELERIETIARQQSQRAPVSLRVNPDVDARTHPYISTGLKENKFGVDIKQAPSLYRYAKSLSHLDVIGIDCHIGSQIIDIAPFIDAMKRVIHLADQLKADGIQIKHLDLGGGLGISYQNETPPQPAELAAAITKEISGKNYKIIIEPGRAIMGNAGILLTQVEYIKQGHKNFAIVDAAMNDLMRPALYSAWQEIIPLQQKNEGGKKLYDVVGPICETGDFLGKERKLNIQQGDLLAIRSSGAYGFTMSSNYNTRTRIAEVMVDGEAVHLIRQRETVESLFENEHLLP
ncbi:MAG: diaminopimelate decarboxylase [Gammaproteobacteria bacterium]|nr:diaminopimelate decarboxylase [Gammaproteobacteria bacterium]